MPSISIILPVYKQSNQVNQIQKIYSKIADSHKSIAEVIIVPNNNDVESFNAFKKIENDLFKVYLVTDGGWGTGLKTGVENASGDWVLYTNSARTHFEELNRFLSEAALGNDKIYKAKRQTRGIIRKMLSKLFELEFRVFSGYSQTDVNGTPKLLSKHNFQAYNLTDNGVFIDSELTYKAKRKGHDFVDIPFYNYERLEGKSTTNSKMALSFLIKLPAKIKSWSRSA